jgi:hypothetical protein
LKGYIMKNFFKSFGLGVVGVIGIVSISAMAQMWPNAPVVGGAAYCSSSVNAACVNTVAAGPALTGNETIPADTNASQGQMPQTVKLSQQNLGIGPYQYSAPLNGVAVSVTPQARRLILEPAGTLAALTVLLQPATALVDNQTFSLCTTQIVTAFTMTAGVGTTLNGAPTALLVPVTTGGASCVGWVYRLANTTWYRIQ